MVALPPSLSRRRFVAAGAACAMAAYAAPLLADEHALPGHGPIVLKAGGHWGHLSVTNTGTDTVSLRPAIIVEGLSGGKWQPLPTEMNLVAACDPDGAVRPMLNPIRLAAHATATPPPWRGWSCNGQCERHCRSNIYWGAGPFRFRVITLSSRSYVSNAFAMPQTPTRPDDAL